MSTDYKPYLIYCRYDVQGLQGLLITVIDKMGLASAKVSITRMLITLNVLGRFADHGSIFKEENI